MRLTTLRGQFLLCALLLFGALQLSAANLVTNGSFETGDFTGWTTLGLPSQTCDIMVVTLNGTYNCNDGFQYQEPDHAFSGTYFMNFPTADKTESVLQDLATVAGHTYNLTFAYANDTFGFGDCSPSDCSLRVTWDGAQVFFTTAATNGWVYVALDGLLATGNSTELEFTGFSQPGQIVLDAVDVNAVPEPSTLALAIPGLLIGASRLHKRFAR